MVMGLVIITLFKSFRHEDKEAKEARLRDCQRKLAIKVGACLSA